MKTTNHLRFILSEEDTISSIVSEDDKTISLVASGDTRGFSVVMPSITFLSLIKAALDQYPPGHPLILEKHDLAKLLGEAIGLFREFILTHEKTHEQAAIAAVTEVLDGIQAWQEIQQWEQEEIVLLEEANSEK